MKKNIYSIVLALILSVILALIFPTWFLRGDARWTHLNETARVDIYFGGNLKNGRVKVEGTGLRVVHPKFLSNEKFQGTVAEIPVSYRTKSYRIKLTPQADEWGKDAAIIIKFLGQHFQYDEKRRPAYVTFRNITINGKSVAKEKVVCYDKHFLLKHPFHKSGLTLTFDVHKPFKAMEFSFMRISMLFCAFLIIIPFSSWIKPVTCRAVEFLTEKDILKALSDSYQHIDPVYRRSFWIIFGVLCFAFGFHTICFMWGNHDWSLLCVKQRWLKLADQGRYMLYSIKGPLSDGIYLPFVHDLLIFITLAINAVLLCRYWRLEKRVIFFVLCGLVLTVQPFTLGMMYFVHMTPEVFIGVTCVLVALLLSENIASVGGSIGKKMACSFIAMVLINFSLAMYPVLVNTIVVAFIGRLLVQSFDWDGSWLRLKSCTKAFMISVFNIVSGIALYKLVITFCFPIRSTYNTDTLPLKDVPERMCLLLKQCFYQLYKYDFPFITQWCLWVFLGFTILLTFYICFSGNLKQKVVRLLLLFASLFGTQTAMGIAKSCFPATRVELFGLVVFEVLMMAVVFRQLRKLRNVSVIIGACIIFAYIIADLNCLRVWKLGYDAEKMLWNRVLARLEVQKGFNPAKKYDVVEVGRAISMRPHYYTGGRHAHWSHLLHCAYELDFSPFAACEFFYPSPFRKGIFSSHRALDRNGYETRLKRLYQAGVLQKAEVWPRPNGLMVWEDIILFVTNGKELEMYKREFERELGKE